MPSHRQRRVAEQIHRELSLLLMLEARDPRLADVTITAVDITPDLMLARVFFTVLAEGDEKVSETQAGLERATGFLRTQLAARLRLRFMPHLAFELDKSAAYGRRIDELLGEIADSSPRGEAEGTSPRGEAEGEERDHPIPSSP